MSSAWSATFPPRATCGISHRGCVASALPSSTSLLVRQGCGNSHSGWSGFWGAGHTIVGIIPTLKPLAQEASAEATQLREVTKQWQACVSNHRQVPHPPGGLLPWRWASHGMVQRGGHHPAIFYLSNLYAFAYPFRASASSRFLTAPTEPSVS